MAVDEALLLSASRGDSPPVLRLYRWEPACLSLGMAQSASDIDFGLLAAYGWDWVRRPTGGRAILHTDELTYSICGPHSESRLSGSVLESYLRLSSALLKALEILGAPAEAREGKPGAPQPAGPVCFEVPSAYEITAGGRKLVGSAQARRREGVLQHGSLPLYGDLTRITLALSYPDEAARLEAAIQLQQHAATLEDAACRHITWDEAAEAFQQAFTECLKIELAETTLTPAEQNLALEIQAQKYTSPAWNERR